MKVIICGSEHWPYKEIVKDEIVRLQREARRLRERLLIIHGGEYGPETVAQEYCRHLGIDTLIQERVLVRGEQSYFRRNELMLNYHKPDLVVCFALSFSQCPITSDMIRRAKEKGYKVKEIDYDSVIKRA